VSNSERLFALAEIKMAVENDYDDMDLSENEGSDFDDDNDATSTPSASLVDCFEDDPVLNDTTRRLLDEEEERRQHRLKYNNVLEETMPDDRIKDRSWCSCLFSSGDKGCSVPKRHSRPRSCYCCKNAVESESVVAKPLKEKTIGQDCITAHPDFPAIALNKVVLTNFARLLSKTNKKILFKDDYTNKEMRFAAYRNVVLWIFGTLGKSVRRVLPSCVVRSIRQRFPKSAGEKHTGFRLPGEISGDSSDSDDTAADSSDDLSDIDSDL